jgi:hypothetical protein
VSENLSGSIFQNLAPGLKEKMGENVSGTVDLLGLKFRGPG